MDYQIVIPSKDGNLPSQILNSFKYMYDESRFRDAVIVDTVICHCRLPHRTLDFKVFERYLCLEFRSYSMPVYTQDDDCVVHTVDTIATHYTPGVVTCNLPPYRRAEYSDGISLVGWGAIFDRNLTSVFNLYFKHYPLDDLFLTECDRVFTGLNKVKLIDVPFTHLPNAESPDRLHKRPDHWERLKEIRSRIYRIKEMEGLGEKVGLVGESV